MTRMSRFGRITLRGAVLFDLVGFARVRLLPTKSDWLLPCIVAAAAILTSSHGTQADGAQADEAGDQYAVAASHYAQKQWDLAAEEFSLFLAHYPRHPKAAEGIYYLGEIFLQSGQLEKAKKRFDQYLRQHPKGIFRRAAAFRTAETAYLASNNTQAKQLLEEFKRRYPEDDLNAYVLSYLGGIALLENDANAAAAAFRSGLAQFPHGQMQDDCRLGLARALNMQGRRQEARQLFQTIVAKPAGRLSDEAQFRLGVLQYEGKDYAESAKTLKKIAADSSPQNRWSAHAGLCRALALRQLGQTDAAHALLEKIASTPKLGVDARYWLAIEHKESGRWVTAAEALEKIAEKCPKGHNLFAAVHFHTGDALLHCGRIDEADAHFDTVLALPREGNRWTDDALLGKASVFVGKKRFEEAIRPLEAYLDVRSTSDGKNTSDVKEAVRNDIRALGQLSICYLRVGNFEKAKNCHARLMEEHAEHELIAPTVEKMADDALEIGESVWSARLFEWLAEDSGREEFQISGLGGLAWSRMENNQKALASSTFERLLLKKIDPMLAAEAAFVRGRLLEGMERFEGALAMYDRVAKNHATSPQHPKALLTAARLRIRLSRTEEAVRLYQRLAKEYVSATNLDVVLYEWSLALHDLGRLEESTKLLQQIHREQPLSRFWSDATYRLAAVAFDAGDHRQAGELLERIIAAAHTKKPNSSSVLAYTFRLKWQIAALQGKWDEVGQTAALLLDECPQSDLRLVAEYWVAESMYRRGDHESAAKRLDALFERTADLNEPWTAMVSLRRAQIFVHQKQWSRALSLASKTSARFPNFEQQHEVDYLLGRCRSSRAEFEEARRAYLRVIRSPWGAKTETAAMAQWMIGETYFHQKDYRSALKAYQRVEVLYDYPKWQAAALLQAAKCRRRLGQPKEASKLYRRLMDKFPASPFVEEAARRLRMTR